MRTVLTSGGIPTFVSTQEHEFLESLDEVAYKDKMNERQAEMAKILTGRGVLQRFRDNDRGIYYTRNQNKGIT